MESFNPLSEDVIKKYFKVGVTWIYGYPGNPNRFVFTDAPKRKGGSRAAKQDEYWTGVIASERKGAVKMFTWTVEDERFAEWEDEEWTEALRLGNVYPCEWIYSSCRRKDEEEEEEESLS